MPRPWFFVLLLEWSLFISRHQTLRLKKESENPPKRISHRLPLPSSSSPLFVACMLLTLQARVSTPLVTVTHLVEALVLDEQSRLFSS